MYVVVVHHMDDVGLMDDAIFLFFFYMMDEGDILLFSCPSIPAIIFMDTVGIWKVTSLWLTDTVGIWKVTSLWLLYSLHVLWWMCWSHFLGFSHIFFFIHLVWTKIVCIMYQWYFLNDSLCTNNDSLYRVSTIFF